MQAQGRSGTIKRYSSTHNCIAQIIKHEGIQGFYKGYLPNMLSSSVINTIELVTYFHSKQILIKRMKDNALLHLLCGFLSGLCCVVIGTPFVMIKTRIMNSELKYHGIRECVVQTLKKEGPLAFYKGWSAFFVGITLWNMVMFVIFEEVKKNIAKVRK